MPVEFVLNGRVVCGKKTEKEAESPQGLQKEFTYSGATLLQQVLVFSALFSWQWGGIKLSQLQILLISFLTGKSENNLI